MGNLGKCLVCGEPPCLATAAHWLARRARPKKESLPGRKLANQKTTATLKVAAACGVLYRSGSEFPLQVGPD